MNVYRADIGRGGVSSIWADRLPLRYARVRADTERLAARLTPEDQTVQSMADASPAKWHRAHTTWFFETFILKLSPDYAEFDSRWAFLHNSYYEAAGPRHPRAMRGVLSRPTVQEIAEYRAYVDEAMMSLLAKRGDDPNLTFLIELGLNHEQQHQELLLTDILNAFAQNSLRPAYIQRAPIARSSSMPLEFAEFEGGLIEIGHGSERFAYDNETPRHKQFLEPFRLANRPVTNSEWLEFIEAGAYRDATHWLSDGWTKAHEERWSAPLYWVKVEGEWFEMTLAGLEPLNPSAPVSNISYYEADAFARFRGARLPREEEWEIAAADLSIAGNLRDERLLCPLPASGVHGTPSQMFGDVWEWTASAYSPYPGFQPSAGALGEYNGKFMSNQMVLRGGSCLTPSDHIRATYRNFFYPHQRWQFSGFRLAKDAERAASSARGITPTSEFLRDVWEGLCKLPKSLSSKYLYDTTGSRLFEQICRLPEYYPTRTEFALLKNVAPSLAGGVRPGTALVEFGSGSSAKPRILLDAIPNIGAYVPIDISRSSLSRTAADLARDYHNLEILPIAGDFTKLMFLPPEVRERPLLGFFPGSTIGNFEEREAVEFLSRARALLGEDKLLIGVDLIKDVDVLLAAYDDADGVTAAFDKNLLVRMNRELDANFDSDAFAHRAVWNEKKSRIEMHLVSLRDQDVRISGRVISFTEGETIHTENSHKYEIGHFEQLAKQAGWGLEKIWVSQDPKFAILLLG